MDYVVARDEEWQSRREGTWRPAVKTFEEPGEDAQRAALPRRAQLPVRGPQAPDAEPRTVDTPELATETPSAIPEVGTLGDRAKAIIIRCPKLPADLEYSWWTLDALDGDEIDDLNRLWVQVGFLLHSPVYLTAYGDGNRPRPGPIKYFRDVGAALGRYLDGKPIDTAKNPTYQHSRFPIHWLGVNTFTLRELSAMATTQTDRSRAGGQSKTPRKVDASRANLAVAREVKHSADAERQERLRRYEAAGLTITQIAEFEGVSYDAARMALKRAKAARERK